MPNTRLYDRKNVAVRNSSQGLVQVAFTSKLSSHPWSVGAGGSQDLSTCLAQYPSVVELGRPLMINNFNDQPNTDKEVEHVVPTGKFWRLIGGMLAYNATAQAATRAPVITIEDSASVVLDTITLSTKTTGQIENDHFLFGTDPNSSGNLAKPAVGKLTIAEPMTAGDTFTIGTQGYIMVAGTDQPAHATRKGINMGADETATKAALEREFVDGDHPLVNAIAFSGDILKFTARGNGLSTDTIIFVEDTITHSSNVLDGSGVLGALTPAAADVADVMGTLDYPTLGVLLVPTDKIVFNITAAHDDDVMDICYFGIEYDNDPR